MAILVTSFFASVDYYKSRKLKNQAECARLYFQSLYISVPTLISLLVAFWFHLTASHLADLDHARSVAYLAGVSGLIVVLSNIVFALFCLPIYGSRLQFQIRE